MAEYGNSADMQPSIEHGGAIICLSGPNNSLKTKVVEMLVHMITSAGGRCQLVDTNVLVRGIMAEDQYALGEARHERSNDVKWVAKIAALLAEQGIICIAPLDSEEAGLGRWFLKEVNGVEISLQTPKDKSISALNRGKMRINPFQEETDLRK